MRGGLKMDDDRKPEKCAGDDPEQTTQIDENILAHFIQFYDCSRAYTCQMHQKGKVYCSLHEIIQIWVSLGEFSSSEIFPFYKLMRLMSQST